MKRSLTELQSSVQAFQEAMREAQEPANRNRPIRVFGKNFQLGTDLDEDARRAIEHDRGI